MSGGMGCMCGVPVLSATYQIYCCDHRLYQWHGNNINEHMLIMMNVPLLVVLLFMYHYMSVLYSILPKNGLTEYLSNKYHGGGAPWRRVLSG